jgi:hypothetical protein
MSKVIDVFSGAIHLNEKVSFHANMTPQELTAFGLVFDREIDMNTGWVFRTIKHRLVERAVQFSLGFKDNALKRASFSLINGLNNTDDIYQENNQFLLQEIGPPYLQDKFQSLYQFHWGTIVSEIDPRNESAYILMNWQ